MAVHIIIPARFQSTRFPGKVLQHLAGKPMLQWVWERACLANPDSVVIATDTDLVADTARAWGAENHERFASGEIVYSKAVGRLMTK